MLTSLIVAGTFVAISLTILLIGRLLFSRDKNRPAGSHDTRRASTFGPLTRALAEVFPTLASTKDKLKKDLVRAGFFQRKAMEEFLAMRNAAIIAWSAFVATAIVLLINERDDLIPNVALVGFVVLALIYGVPRLVLSSMASARVQRIQYALPDVLDMINMMITGGLPVQGAIKRVSQEVATPHPDLGCELAIIDRQAEAGTLEQALSQFADRVDVPDVSALSNLVRHAERLGGNLATSLRDFSDSIRRTRRQRAEERGNKSSIKLLFPVVFCLAPPIYILLLGPAALELREFVMRENQPGGALLQQASGSLSPSVSRSSGDTSSDGTP